MTDHGGTLTVVFRIVITTLLIALASTACSSSEPVEGIDPPTPVTTQEVQDLLAASTEPIVLNVWASWCVSCRAEHKVITELASRNLVTVVGLNYKDEPADAERWLQQFGNPYATSVIDRDGRVGIDWGVYGVPETFVIGADGLIKYKHIGPVTHESLEQKIMPVLKELLG